MNSGNLKQLVLDGYNHLDKSQMDKASACFHRVLEIEPKQQDALYGLGRIAYKLKKWDESVSYFSEFSHKQSNYALAKLWRGLAYQNLNNHEASNDFAEISYQEFDTYISYLLQKERFKEAIESIKAIIQTKPEFPHLWYLLGTVLHRRGFLQQAIASLTYELELNSDFTDAWLTKALVIRELGCIQQDQEKLEEAVFYFSRVIELKDDKVDLLRQLALTLKLLERNEEALNIYSQILNLVPNSKDDISVRDIYEQALLLIALDRKIEAVDRLDRLIWLDYYNFKALYNRACILFQQGEYEDVIRDCNKILYEQRINSSLAWFIRGNALCELEDIHLTKKVWALDSIQRAWELNPSNVQILKKRNAVIERLTGRNVESINVLIGFLTDMESPQRLIKYLEKEAQKESQLQDAMRKLDESLGGSMIGEMAEWLRSGNASPEFLRKSQNIDIIKTRQKDFLAWLLPKLFHCNDKSTFAAFLGTGHELVTTQENSIYFSMVVTHPIYAFNNDQDLHKYLLSVVKLATFLCEYRVISGANLVSISDTICHTALVILGNRQKIWPRYEQDCIAGRIDFWGKIQVFFYRVLVHLRLATVWYTPFFGSQEGFNIELGRIKSFVVKLKFTSSSHSAQAEVILIGKSLVGFGNTYLQDFSTYNPEENLENAIQIFEVAKLLWQRCYIPREIAETEVNLGRTYTRRLKGNKSENLEEAIKLYENASCFFSSFSSHNLSPENLLAKHKLMQAWGETLRIRIRGDRKRNLEQSIEILTTGIDILDLDKYICEYADAQVNLADTYLEYTRCLAKLNLKQIGIEKIDQAILLYISAINKYSQADFAVDQAEAQYKIGIAYFLYAELLIDLNYDTEIIISNLKKSIVAFVSSKDYFGHNFRKLEAQINQDLGTSYTKLSLFEDKYLNLDIAIDFYSKSFFVFTPEVFQLEYGQTKIQIGKAYYESNRYEEAYDSFLESVKTLEKLRSDVTNLFGTEEDKQKFSEQWIDSYFGLVDSCLKLAQNNIDLSDPVNDFNELDRYFRSNNIYYARALEYIERSKAKNLVELLANRYLYPKQEALGNEDFQEICSELDRFRREIPALQRKLEIIASNPSQEETQSNLDYFDIANSLANLRKQQDSLLKRIGSFDSTFGYTQTVKSIAFSEIQDLIDANTVAVEWFITHNSFCVFIVLQKLQFPLVWNYSSEDVIDLNTFLNSYLSSYKEDRNSWIQNLPLRLQQLSNILHLEEILEQLIPDTITEIVLIPHQKLHLVPLHALPLMDGSCLLDRFSGGVRYAPSCQLLQQIQQKQTYSFEQLFAIKNPKNNLPPLKFADIELTNILDMNLFANTKVIADEHASREKVVSKNVQHTECLHFACHGSFNPNSPLESSLKLSGTSPEEINLTFIDIFSLSLESCRLVTLSACETGIVDTKSTSDEYIGLPSAFLFAGSTSVVSSLWIANDLATALLMIKFYEILKLQKVLKKIKVALALNQAQLWLRGISRNELKQRLEFFFPNKPATQNKLLRDLENQVSNPFYWAAFCVLGS